MCAADASTTLTFGGLTNEWAAIPAGYSGLQWEYVEVVGPGFLAGSSQVYSRSGYARVDAGDAAVAYTGGSDQVGGPYIPAAFYIAGGDQAGGSFTLMQMTASPAWASPYLTLRLEGYADSDGSTAPTAVQEYNVTWHVANVLDVYRDNAAFTGLRRVKMTASAPSGVTYPTEYQGYHVAFDNLVLAFRQPPQPSSG